MREFETHENKEKMNSQFLFYKRKGNKVKFPFFNFHFAVI